MYIYYNIYLEGHLNYDIYYLSFFTTRPFILRTMRSDISVNSRFAKFKAYSTFYALIKFGIGFNETPIKSFFYFYSIYIFKVSGNFLNLEGKKLKF